MGCSHRANDLFFYIFTYCYSINTGKLYKHLHSQTFVMN